MEGRDDLLVDKTYSKDYGTDQRRQRLAVLNKKEISRREECPGLTRQGVRDKAKEKYERPVCLVSTSCAISIAAVYFSDRPIPVAGSIRVWVNPFRLQD